MILQLGEKEREIICNKEKSWEIETEKIEKMKKYRKLTLGMLCKEKPVGLDLINKEKTYFLAFKYGKTHVNFLS